MALGFFHEEQLPPPVAGIDEVGRGPWAGPVVAAAVVLERNKMPEKLAESLRDSKKLKAAERALIFRSLMGTESCRFGIGAASAREIDDTDILKASGLAMRRAMAALPLKPSSALVDGPYTFGLEEGLAARGLIKGDDKSPSIAAASIIAKVTRDRIMDKLSRRYPNFDWEQNKGYGTAAHRSAIRRFALSPHHRFSFKPIAALRPRPE